MKEQMQLEPFSTLIRDNQLLTLLQEISLGVAQANTVDQAFADVLAHICRFMEWPLGHVYLWSPESQTLVSSYIWYMTDTSTIASFKELSEATRFKPGEGTLGLVWESKEAIIILDVQGDSRFVRHLPIEEEGIRAYFAFPILINGEVTAVLEFFSPVSIAPDQGMASIIHHVSALLGLAMQRQQMLGRLQESEAQLAEAQRTAHVGHWQWDVPQNKVTWSSELYRIYGLSPETFAAHYESYLGYIHPEDLDLVQGKVESAYLEGLSFDYFHRIIRSDGEMRVLHARGRPIYDQAGNIIKLYGTAQDMTKQKEAEQKLAQTVNQLSALMEIGQAVSATLNLDIVYERVLTLVRPLINSQALILLLNKENMLEVIAQNSQDAPNFVGARIPLGSGIAGEVWQSGQSVFLQGEECRQRFSHKLKQHSGYQPQALLATPIRWQKETMGVLEAIHEDINAFNEDDLRLLQTAADWTAIAIAKANQYNLLQRRFSERDAMVTISNALTQTLELNTLLQIIVDCTQEIVPDADWAAIHLLHPQTEQLELMASAGLDIVTEGYLVRIGEEIATHVMAKDIVVNVPDVQNDPRHLHINADNKATSLLVAPIKSRQKRIGTISVQCTAPNRFRIDDEGLLKMLGAQAGMAIENARLYEARLQERKRAEKTRERMRHMARRIVKAQEDERGRIARELHDESGQSLTSLKISLNLIRLMLPDDMVDIKKSLSDVLDLTDKTMTNLRLLSHNLRPPGLDIYGLDAALAGLCQDFETHTLLKINYNGAELFDLASLPALTLYRFAQEALTNVAKHAQATKVQVALDHDLDVVRLRIEDNGRGFNPPDFEEDASLPQGFGLVGMLERVEMVNGRLEIESIIGEGSQLTAVVPFTKEKI